MQPFQWDLRCSAAKDTSITHAAMAPRNLDAADTALQNTIQLRTAAQDITALKPDLDAKAEKSTILNAF